MAGERAQSRRCIKCVPLRCACFRAVQHQNTFIGRRLLVFGGAVYRRMSATLDLEYFGLSGETQSNMIGRG